jgi:pimeloyl-ACP methyl ester carboxylesterase
MTEPYTAVSNRWRDGDLLVLLHGLGCSKKSFDGVFTSPELDGYAVCAIDFPGHGSSTEIVPAGCDALESYGHTRLHLTGHSMGGAVAVIIAAAGNCDVTSLTSIDGNLVREDCGLVSRGIAEQSLAQFTSYGYGDFIAELYDAAEPSAHAWARWAASAKPAAMHAAARSLVEWSDSGRLLEQFNSFGKKHAFIYGDRDDKAYLLPQIKGADIITVPDAAHFMMVDNPTAFHRALAEAIA